MNKELSPEEEKTAQMIMVGNRRDNLYFNLTYLLPSMFIIGLGVKSAEPTLAFAGMAAYLIIHLWTLSQQARHQEVLASLVRKLMGNGKIEGKENDSCQRAG